MQLDQFTTAAECDACAMRRFALYEPVQFIKLFLADKLEFSKVMAVACYLVWSLNLMSPLEPCQHVYAANATPLTSCAHSCAVATRR